MALRGKKPAQVKADLLGGLAPVQFLRSDEADSFGGHLTPSVTVSYDLGSSSLELRDVWVGRNLSVGGQMQGGGNLIPDTDNTYDIGTTDLEWKDIYIDGTAYLDNIDVGTVSTDVLPDADDTRDLGSSSFYWAEARATDIYLAALRPKSGSSVTIHADLIPGDPTYDVGTTGSPFVEVNSTSVFCDNLDSQSGSTIEVGDDFLPDTDDTYDLGSAAKEWAILYGGRARVDSFTVGRGSTPGRGSFNSCLCHSAGNPGQVMAWPGTVIALWGYNHNVDDQPALVTLYKQLAAGTSWSELLSTGDRVTIPASDKEGYGTFSPGTYTFAAGDKLQPRIKYDAAGTGSPVPVMGVTVLYTDVPT